MHNMSLETITEVCKGTYYGPEALKSTEVASVVIDSRQAEKNGLFVALKGGRADGHDYIPQVFAKGAFALSEKILPEELLKETGSAYILVENCEIAFRKIAAHYRNSLPVKVVGITGSVGKTSTKETVATFLAEKYNVFKTEANLNNELGVPLMTLRLRDEHEVAVLEMGINHFGEMTNLTMVAQPDIAVITNITECHIEYLEDRDGVLRAKSEIFKGVKPDGIAVLNGDDDKLITVKEVNGKLPVFFGLGKDNAFYADEIVNHGMEGTSFVLHGIPECPDGLKATVSMPGMHVVRNIVCAAAVATALGVSAEQIKSAIGKMQALDGRGRISHAGKLTIMEDCYNANPASMRAALEVLSYNPGRKIAILGDMLELGTEEERLHREIGEVAVERNVDLLLCVGDLGRYIAEGADEEIEVYHYENNQDLIHDLPDYLQDGDSILIKASHRMNFPEIIDAIKEIEALKAIGERMESDAE